MVSEVSCRAFGFFEACAARGIVDLDELLADCPVPRATLEDPNARMSWGDFAQLMQRLRELVGDDAALEESAEGVLVPKVTGPARRVASTLTDPLALYRVLLRWFSPVFFRNVEVTTRELDRNALAVEFFIPEPFEPCVGYMLVARGSLRVIPRLLDLPDAAVRGDVGERRSSLVVTPPTSRRLGSRLRLAWRTLAGGSNALIDELDSLQQQLTESYRQVARFENAIAKTSGTHQRLIAAFPDLVVRLRGDGTVIDIHTGSDFPERELIQGLVGQNLFAVAPLISNVDPKRFDEGQQLLQEAMTDQRIRDTEVVTAGTGKGKRHFEVRIIPDGPEEALVLVRDVTERRRMEERLAIAERMASLGTVAAGVSHELNNPLTFVLANLGVARELAAPLALGDPGAYEELAQALRDAEDGAVRMRRIIAELGDYARSGSDELEPVDVAVALESAITITHNEIRLRAELVRRLAPNLVINANPGQITQVFVNLLINAVQAIPEDAPPGTHRIVVEAVDRGDDVEVRVIDSGEGMTPDTLSRMFDPFFTTKSKHGTGLGLAISQRIVSELGGSIEATSRVGEGTTFRVTFPRAPHRPVTGDLTATAAELVDDAKRCRVLVVDDEPLVARALRRALRDHDVVVVHGGGEALTRLRETPDFDVVLCDLMMPGMSGLELRRLVDNELADATPPFLFMSGGTLSDAALAYIEEHPTRFLRKPVGPAEIRAFIQQEIQAKR